MKAKYLLILFLCSSLFSFAQTASVKKDTIKVWGNCESCKKHIETAAKAAGASKAVWNVDSKFLVVNYDATKTSNQKIQQRIASAGYDTQDATGSQKAYDNLDDCCKYDRKSTDKVVAKPKSRR